jgi:hypothetical protein
MQSVVNTLQEVWVHLPASEAIVEHAPLLHDRLPQFTHVTPPAPHVAVDWPPTQLPFVSQQPPQWLELEPHTGLPASSRGAPSASLASLRLPASLEPSESAFRPASSVPTLKSPESLPRSSLMVPLFSPARTLSSREVLSAGRSTLVSGGCDGAVPSLEPLALPPGEY